MLEKWRKAIINIDCRDGLIQLPDNSINCVITSPPYWSLRDYNIPPSIWDGDPECEHQWDNKIKAKGGSNWDTIEWNDGRPKNASQGWKDKVSNTKATSQGQFCSKCGAWLGCLGLEPNFELYIKHLCDIYDDVKRVLRKDGTCWVNLGDSYSNNSSGGNKVYGNPEFNKNRPSRELTKVPTKKVGNIPAKSLLMIPQRFVIEMVNRGWILRNVIIWHKPNCMPSSVRDRFTIDFEYVYFFVKSKKYWFEQQREGNHILTRKGTVGGHKQSKDPNRPTEGIVGGFRKDITTIGRNKRCVWKIPTKPNPEAHFATFPPNLVKPMIKSGCPEYVCKKCGKAREKIIERKKWKPTRKHEGKHYKDMLKVSESSAFNHREDWEKFKKENPDKFKGYTDCGCNAGFKPGIVLDIFAGTGTTCKTAFNLGRDYIGFEISKDYVDNIAKKTLTSTKNMRLTDFLKLLQPKK